MYPRKLTSQEKEWILYLLPGDRKCYAEYRKLAEGMIVIGEGRFGEGNFVLGFEGDAPDFSYPSLPMFACGQIICEDSTIQVSLHEFYDNKIEYSINNLSGEEIPNDKTEIRRWSYSYWEPGDDSPFENDALHQYELSGKKGELVLALSPANHSIWLYDSHSEVNHVVPVTNFINELIRGDKRIDKKEGINLDYVFSNLKLFSLDDFRRALVEYNKHWHKIDMGEFEVP